MEVDRPQSLHGTPPSAEAGSIQTQHRTFGVATSGNGLLAAVARESPRPKAGDGCANASFTLPHTTHCHIAMTSSIWGLLLLSRRGHMVQCCDENAKGVVAGLRTSPGSCGAAACSCCGCMDLQLRWAPTQQQPCHACLPWCTWVCRSLQTGCGTPRLPSHAQARWTHRAAAAVS